MQNLKKALTMAIMGIALLPLTNHAQTWVWKKLPGISNLPTNWHPYPTSLDASNGVIYSAVNGTGWTFNMRSNSFQPMPISNWPGNLGSDIWSQAVYDGASSSLYLAYNGSSYVYRLPASGGSPAFLGGTGAAGNEYQNMWYWNPTTHSVGRFGGYGFGAVKNWRFEFSANGNSWSQIEANSPGRGPWGRTARNYALAADARSIFLYGGDGNSTGNQGYVDPGYYGNGSTTGQMDRLCDLWRLDFASGTWTNFLAGNNYNYPYAGPIVYFPPLNAVLMVTGWGYTPTNFGVGTSAVAMYRLGRDPGFAPVVVAGDTPNIADSVPNLDGSVFYDNVGQRVLYFNSTGVYSLSMASAIVPSVALVKAVKPSFSNLTLGANYQLQATLDLTTWYDQGLPFTATSPNMDYPWYYDVANWGQLFFRLQIVP